MEEIALASVRSITEPSGKTGFTGATHMPLTLAGIATIIDSPHSRAAEAVLTELAVSPEGLAAAEAGRRLTEVGPNRLREPPRVGPLLRFVRHFHDTLIYVLLASATITAVLSHWVDTAVILGVVLLNAIIGFIQEGKAEQALAGIRRMLSPHAQARRDGDWHEIDAADLVPGDVVRLRSGDRVPADLRLLEVASLRLEESALTGESQPASKRIEPVAAGAALGDRSCMAYAGCLVAAGRGIGVVTATGAVTELGRITTMIAAVEPLATPLTRSMAAFGRKLSAVILVLAAVMFTVGWMVHGDTVSELLFASIGFAVAAIPEGLPAVLTITLAIGVQRMAKRKAITRRLPSVETLGSVTVICSDKTGTLTRNEMTARRIATRAGDDTVEGAGYDPIGSVTRDGKAVALADSAALAALVEAMALCNDAVVSRVDGVWTLVGEPTEGALRTLALKTGFAAAEGHRRLAVIPFESEAKYMAILDRIPEDGTRLLMKGAPDQLLTRCTHQRGADGADEPLDPAFWKERIASLGGQGLRVLGAAARRMPDDAQALAEADLAGLTMLGLVGIADPPRSEAVEAIRRCRDAGIRIIMITGDHAGTAAAIARELGLADDLTAVSGEQLETASDDELRALVRTTSVFARTSPEHKLRLVTALQANGEVVAMTGDGVNDAPALKRADVGVAMGIKGTEATKEAAAVVLADDNFATIVNAVEEGRTIYENLRKAILFILPTNGAEAMVILAAVVGGMVLPLTPVQILWVNMVTEITLSLSLALAFEPTVTGTMARPPRRPGAPILGGYFLWRITFVSVLIGGSTMGVFLYQTSIGASLELARSLALNTLVVGQAFYLFNCRSLQDSALTSARLIDNPVAWLSVGVLAVLQLLFVYLPPMNGWFGTTALEAHHWLIPLGIGVAVFLVVEAEKAVVRAWQRSGRGAGCRTP